ncbi:hypothetical protein D3C87_1023130 [compost metagenome]
MSLATIVPPVSSVYQTTPGSTTWISAAVGALAAQKSWVSSRVVGVGASFTITVTASLSELIQPEAVSVNEP